MPSPLGSDHLVSNLKASTDKTPTPSAHAKDSGSSTAERTLEIGHCFQLPSVYCNAAKTRFDDAQGSTITPLMSSYGLGISRLFGHVALAHTDLKGIRLPPQVAPFLIALLPLIHSTLPVGHREPKDSF